MLIHLRDVDWSVEEPLFLCVTGEGEPIRAQHLERLTEGFKIQLEGAEANVVSVRGCDCGCVCVRVCVRVWGVAVGDGVIPSTLCVCVCARVARSAGPPASTSSRST